MDIPLGRIVLHGWRVVFAVTISVYLRVYKGNQLKCTMNERDSFEKKMWNKLCIRLNVEQWSMKWWDIIEEKYHEGGRFYHNLQHIRELLTYVDHYIDNIDNVDTVVLAIFFHDVIYDPKSPNNEDDSIQLFAAFVNDCKSHELSCISSNVIDLAKTS